MLQAVQRHWAPRATRVSISTWDAKVKRTDALKSWQRWRRQSADPRGWERHTAVWAVMWVQPTILAPASGFSPWALFLKEMRADMSVADKVRGSSEDIKGWKNKAFLEGVRAVNGCKMETNWKAMSATAVAARPEVDVSSNFPSTDHVHRQCKQPDRGETWGDLLTEKKTPEMAKKNLEKNKISSSE